MHIHFVCYEFIEFIGLLLQIHKYTLGYYYKYTNTLWVIIINTQIHFGLLCIFILQLEIEIVEPHFVKE
jgi:hypothetical protein